MYILVGRIKDGKKLIGYRLEQKSEIYDVTREVCLKLAKDKKIKGVTIRIDKGRYYLKGVELNLDLDLEDIDKALANFTDKLGKGINIDTKKKKKVTSKKVTKTTDKKKPKTIGNAGKDVSKKSTKKEDEIVDKPKVEEQKKEDNERVIKIEDTLDLDAIARNNLVTIADMATYKLRAMGSFNKFRWALEDEITKRDDAYVVTYKADTRGFTEILWQEDGRPKEGCTICMRLKGIVSSYVADYNMYSKTIAGIESLTIKMGLIFKDKNIYIKVGIIGFETV